MRADKLEALSVIDRQADFFRELADEIWDQMKSGTIRSCP